MEVNNAIYDELGHMWWNEAAGFEITSLRYCLNPVRYAYFKRKLQQLRAPGKTVLDLGCGGGFLSEQFAKDGFAVTGIDPSSNSLAAAREHAAQTGLDIEYRPGRGESLPFADASFDIVACCDVLEHVDDPPRVIGEVARVLRPGGVFFYDTVNRTLRSKFLLIKIWQDWNLAGGSAPNAHVWEKFITPGELSAMLLAAHLSPGDRTGIGPAKWLPAIFYGLWRIRTGRIRAAAIARAFPLRETSDLGTSYMGWALKPS